MTPMEALSPRAASPERAAMGGAAALLLVVAAVAVACSFAIVASRAGGLEYDDAHYLDRGLYHFHQIENRNWRLPRLAWSLSLERQRPPLFHGWVAAGALALGDRTIEPLFLWSLWGPLAALLLFTALSGRRAGGATGAAIAVLTLVAAPAVLELASRTLVDVTLAATVAATLFLLARRLDGGGVGASALVGAAAGAAALTKLTAPLFLAPMVLVATFHIGRFESRAAALRFLGVATLVAAAVAAPWYLRHGVEAVEFARYAASFWPCADTGSAWSRPLRLIGATASWPLAVGLAGLAWFAHSKRRAVPQGGVPWGALALAGSLPAAVVVMLPPVFEPRYLFSALPPLAALAGGWASSLFRRLPPVGRALLVVASGGLAAASLVPAARARVVPVPWRTGSVLQRIAADPKATVRVCTIGNRPDWNVFKVRLVAERERLRPRMQVEDGLVLGCPERALAECDALLVLDPSGVPAEESQQRLNEGLAECVEALRPVDAGFARCAECDGELGTVAPVSVWLKSSPRSSDERGTE